MITDELWQQGYDARKEGRSRGCNPEPRPAYPDHAHWARGWEAADREERDARGEDRRAGLEDLLRECLEVDRAATLDTLMEVLTMEDIDGLQECLP